MKVKHHYHIFRRKIRLCRMKAGIIAFIICAFLLPSYVEYEETGNNYYIVTLDGVTVGTIADESLAEKYMLEARKRIVSDMDGLVLINSKLETNGQEKQFGRVSSKKTVVQNMEQVLRNNIRETLHHSYTVKVNDTTVNLGSYGDVHKFLEGALAIYDTEKLFDVGLVLDPTREINVLTTEVSRKEYIASSKERVELIGGIEAVFETLIEEAKLEEEKKFEDYEEGLVDISFVDTIEVAEAYLLEDEIMSVEKAVNLVTKEQETQVVYKVESGDTLSEISEKNNIPLENLVAINDSLEDENTTIRVGQELVITVPEPDLSIGWKKEEILIEEYDAPIEYVDNNTWYTTQRKTLQEPSAGVRKVVAVTEYKNGKEVGREILKEVVYADAVPKIVERGTKIPPTFIKPIYGGRLTSNFGSRSAPTKGASSYHKGIDWGTPTGTSVVAANGGRVITAGWVSGYGYAVYIDHGDGRQTRYGHLSKVLVKVGQTVSQGERIALSGNTGISTGPHLHFEIRIGGTAVNPLKYIK